MIADSTVRSMCTIGQEISIWCEKNHITNQELADALAVSRETVKRIKNGTRELTSKEMVLCQEKVQIKYNQFSLFM